MRIKLDALLLTFYDVQFSRRLNGNAYFCLVTELEVPCPRLCRLILTERDQIFKGRGRCLEGTNWMEERIVGMKPLNYPPLNFDVPCPLAMNIRMTYFFCGTCLDIPNTSMLILVLKHTQKFQYVYIFIYNYCEENTRTKGRRQNFQRLPGPYLAFLPQHRV